MSFFELVLIGIGGATIYKTIKHKYNKELTLNDSKNELSKEETDTLEKCIKECNKPL
jgi:hypothetical protein